MCLNTNVFSQVSELIKNPHDHKQETIGPVGSLSFFTTHTGSVPATSYLNCRPVFEFRDGCPDSYRSLTSRSPVERHTWGRTDRQRFRKQVRTSSETFVTGELGRTTHKRNSTYSFSVGRRSLSLFVSWQVVRRGTGPVQVLNVAEFYTQR